jgi:two-component system, OmpR family, response regulator RegX3
MLGAGGHVATCHNVQMTVDAGRPRLLVVEDDDDIVEPLREGLEREGFDITVASTGHDAIGSIDGVDLVLLDLGLPDMDGADVCRILRDRSDVPIIALTARDEELDRVLLLELGADDYVVKPFGLRELVARIRAIRRRVSSDSRGVGSRATAVTVGALTIDVRARRVVVRGEEVALTPKEFDLLARLAEEPGAAIRREQIIEEVWDEHWWGPTKTLDVHIASLRKKLGDPRWITTIRGVGYRLEPLP